MQSIETTATVEDSHHLVVDSNLPYKSASRVRVIILFDETSKEVSEKEWLKMASENPAFEEWNNPLEDIYTLKDGKPFHD